MYCTYTYVNIKRLHVLMIIKPKQSISLNGILLNLAHCYLISHHLFIFITLNSYLSMTFLVLKTNIPCENCSKSIRQTLTNVPGVIKVECSVKDGEIRVDFDDGSGNENEMKSILIAEMKKTGRICT